MRCGLSGRGDHEEGIEARHAQKLRAETDGGRWAQLIVSMVLPGQRGACDKDIKDGRYAGWLSSRPRFEYAKSVCFWFAGGEGDAGDSSKQETVKE